MALVGATTTPSPFAELIPKLIDTQCGYCGRAVSMQRIGPVIECRDDDGPHGTHYVTLHTSYLCPRGACKRPNIAFFEITSTGDGYRYISEGPQFLPRGQAEPMPDLPDEIQGDRREAWSCYYGGDLRAAVIMARCPLDAIHVSRRAPPSASVTATRQTHLTGDRRPNRAARGLAAR